ncbi:MAG: O-antigen ligase family protein [Planctomycetota bacterium]|jgi:O-antigen ligase
MSFLDNFNPVILLLFLFVGSLSAVLLCYFSLKRFELAIIMMFVSPWAHWIFSPPVQEGDVADSEPALGTYIRILMIAFAGLIGLLKFFQIMSGRLNRIHFYLLLVGGFILYALVSVVYSIDQKYTGVRSVEFMFFFFFLMGLYYWLKDRVHLDTTLNLYFVIMTCGIILNTVAIVIFPGRVHSLLMPGRIQGLLGHPNTLGAFCMLTYPALFWKYSGVNHIGKGLVAVLFCLVLVLHVMSGSRASFATSVIGIFVWTLFSERANLSGLAKVLTFCLVLVFGGVGLMSHKPASLERGSESITDLTGRTEFWQGCIQLIGEKPVTGYGYGVAGKVWSDPRFNRAGQFLWSGSAKASLHNGYLSMAIGLGVTGLVIWLLIVLIPTWKVLQSPPSSYKALAVVMLVQGMILNIFESAVVSGSQIITSLIFWIFLIIAMKMPLLNLSCRANERPAVRMDLNHPLPAGV